MASESPSVYDGTPATTMGSSRTLNAMVTSPSPVDAIATSITVLAAVPGGAQNIASDDEAGVLAHVGSLQVASIQAESSHGVSIVLSPGSVHAGSVHAIMVGYSIPAAARHSRSGSGSTV